MEAFAQLVLGLLTHGWDCSWKYVNCLRCLQKNLDILRGSMEEVKNIRDHTKQEVELAEAEQMVRKPEVQGWLQIVEVTEPKVEKALVQWRSIQIDDDDVRQRCMYCFCPKNCWISVKLSIKVVKLLATVQKIRIQAYKFDEVVYRSCLPVVQEMPGSPTVGMESLLEKAMEMLKDDKVSSLGIYGMGGVGKTTLLKKINNEFLKRNSDIDVVVIWVAVSKELNLGRIQNEIAKKLRLSHQDQGDQFVEARAHAIFNILSRKNFVLLLDDCWERVDLVKIGIPHPNDQARSSKSKVVFTTRSEAVCGLMEAKKKMRVECLDSGKAWQLFEEKVGEEALNSDPQVRKLAGVVVKECCGLPLALITVGRTMASKKTPQEWKHAITILKKYTSEFSGMGDEVFPLMKFSYDNLHSDTIRSCFLYCSLYPEDFNIRKDDLIVHWIAEGFLNGFDSMDEAYDRGHDIIGCLKAACLLESGLDDSETQVKMHDVIRDLAIWIGCECGRKRDKFLIRARANLSEAPSSEKLKNAEKVSLMDNDICFLQDAPACFNLSTLMLQSNMSLRDINCNFFLFMPALKVLNLSGTGITHLPTSISNLVELQLLDLSNCPIEDLPIELMDLENLRYLNLSFTSSLRLIPGGIIASFSNLQMLNLFESANGNCITEEFGVGVRLSQIERLKHLSALGLTINSSVVLHKFLNNNKFQVCTRRLMIKSCPTLVSVNVLPSSTFPALTSTLPPSSSTSLNVGDMKNLQTLCLQGCTLLEQLTISFVWFEKETRLFSTLETLELLDLPKLTIIWERGLLSFQKLHTIHIRGCNTLKNLTWILHAPTLKELDIFGCNGLESILDEVTNQTNERMNPLSRLKKLELENLPKLNNICMLALAFPSLEVISVINCPRLAKLPFDSNSAQKTLRIILGSVEWWNMLQWEDDVVKSSFQPHFKPY